MMNHNILLIGPSYPFRGGIAHYTTLLYNHLKTEHDVTFYSYKRQYFKHLYPGKDDKDSSKLKIEADGIERVLDSMNPFTWIKAGIKARKYSLIILPWWTLFWVPYYLIFLTFAKNKNNKVIFLCHNVIEHETGFIKKIASKIVLNRGDGFILHSSEEEMRLKLILKKKKIKTRVYPHPSYNVFNKNRYIKSSAREELGIQPIRNTFLFFGFIREYKGLYYLLKAMPKVVSKYNNILLYIVGEIWEKKTDYFNLIRELKIENNVRFINDYIPNEDIELYFKASDFIVLPYIKGTGSGILQVAYGMNKPVIATDIGPFKDFVENEKTGLLIPSKDEIKLADAIIKMYEKNLITRMEKNIPEYEKHFSWEYMVDNIISLYNEIS